MVTAPDLVQTTFLTVGEVAEMLRVSPATLRSWVAKGEGPPALRFGKQIRYRPERVRDWIEQQEARVS